MATSLNDDFVELNVGGKFLTTRVSTLRKDTESRLADMFRSMETFPPRDDKGRCYIDCDGDIFVHVLEFLRFKTLPPAKHAVKVNKYASQYGLTQLESALRAFSEVKKQRKIDNLNQNETYYKEIKNQILQKIESGIHDNGVYFMIFLYTRCQVTIVPLNRDVPPRRCKVEHPPADSPLNESEFRDQNGADSVHTIIVDGDEFESRWDKCMAYELRSLGYSVTFKRHSLTCLSLIEGWAGQCNQRTLVTYMIVSKWANGEEEF